MNPNPFTDPEVAISMESQTRTACAPQQHDAASPWTAGGDAVAVATHPDDTTATSAARGRGVSAGVAALLSAIWPGLGQLCSGRPSQAIRFTVMIVAWFVVAVCSIPLMAVAIGFLTLPLAIVLMIATWAWGMVDAYSGAKATRAV